MNLYWKLLPIGAILLFCYGVVLPLMISEKDDVIFFFGLALMFVMVIPLTIYFIKSIINEVKKYTNGEKK